MKRTLRTFLVIALFSSITLADGNMGSGGLMDGNMGSGGKTCTQNCRTIDQTDKSRIEETSDFMQYVQDFLTKIFG